MNRTSGVLMHISSLAGNRGIGSFGKEAYRFVDFLVECKQTYWQILPLSTTSYGDSPYQSFSAFAGNTHFIDLDLLAEEGYLVEKDFADISFGEDVRKVDYAKLFEERKPILEKAVKAFLASKDGKKKLAAFEKKETWLEDYADFMAIKEHFDYKSLAEWPEKDLVLRKKKVLDSYRKKLEAKRNYYKVTQYFFFEQWYALKAYANKHELQIIGDMPIYVSADSVEVWTRPELFQMSKDGKLKAVAGCPPDDFSADGQLWGNPLYDWKQHKKEGYAWWIYRVEESLKLYDLLRVDHFKGFSDYWKIPADAETAKGGVWEEGPGMDLFRAIRKALGEVNIIAENLGFIDAKAEKLLEDSKFPGMKILQFAFEGGAGNTDLPHHYTKDSVAYTGTHDNDVISAWYAKQSEEVQAYISEYLHQGWEESIQEAMIRAIYASVSDLAIVCMQDLMELKADSRMNTPSQMGGNWEWRMDWEDLTEDRKDFLRRMTELYGREAEPCDC